MVAVQTYSSLSSSPGCMVQRTRAFGDLAVRNELLFSPYAERNYMYVGNNVQSSVKIRNPSIQHVPVLFSCHAGRPSPVDCCPSPQRNSPQCCNVYTPGTDTFYMIRNLTCLTLLRSTPCFRCRLGEFYFSPSTGDTSDFTRDL